MHDTRYKGNPTPKARLIDVQDWLLVFNAIVAMTPEDIKAIDTIDAHDVIRGAAHAAMERIKKDPEIVLTLEQKRDEHVAWTSFNFGSKAAQEVAAIYNEGIASRNRGKKQ